MQSEFGLRGFSVPNSVQDTVLYIGYRFFSQQHKRFSKIIVELQEILVIHLNLGLGLPKMFGI